MYIRIAHKNPLQDVSVVGWASNSTIMAEFEDSDPEDTIDALVERGWVVEFSAADLATTDPDQLPQLHVGAVCTFEALGLEEWAEEFGDDLERMGYDLDSDDELKVWLVEGEEKDVDDFEGVYVIATKATDVTEQARDLLGE